jgi:protein TonB
MIAALGLNSSMVLALILIPLVYPEALPRMALAFLMEVPPPPPAPAPMVRAETHTAAVSSHAMEDALAAPRQIPRTITILNRPEAAPTGPVAMLEPGPGVIGGMGTAYGPAEAPKVVRATLSAAPLRISSGVAESTVVERTLPAYPAIAKAAGVQGTVVLAAAISKTGTVINLRVVSGPAMLQQAALDAVKTWRYRPYTLNGEPVEVETTVNVVFTLGR